ncbi:lytic transglycosylase domain-containing protein [Hoeflea sp.]|uniref:lytic transglycosylase domain-containing protein n=1 Tax=Hoeflea sp. TaxID=1940281 RepID=UPI003B0189DA
MRTSLIVMAIAMIAPAHAADIDRFHTHVLEASKRFAVPDSWIRAVIMAESNGDPRAVSPRGAMGLMQLMPGTWEELRDRHDLGADPFDPRANILAGTAYLRAMHERFGYPGLFAAYNAGPGRYGKHLKTGKPLPAETRAYVARIEETLAGAGEPTSMKAKAGPPGARNPPPIAFDTRLFFSLSAPPNDTGNGERHAPDGDLFVPLSRPEPDRNRGRNAQRRRER